MASTSILPSPRACEHRLGQHRAGQGNGHEQADDRQQRDHHVAQRVLVDHEALVQALGARRADVIGADNLEHGGARQAADGRRQGQAQGERRQSQVVQHVPHRGQKILRVFEDFTLGDHVEHGGQITATNQRKQVQMQGKDDEQQDAEPEHRHGQAQESDEAGTVIHQRVLPMQG